MTALSHVAGAIIGIAAWYTLCTVQCWWRLVAIGRGHDAALTAASDSDEANTIVNRCASEGRS